MECNTYDFMVLFAALNSIKENNYFIKSWLLDFIKIQKYVGAYKTLLTNIDLEDINGSLNSNSLNDAIERLVAEEIFESNNRAALIINNKKIFENNSLKFEYAGESVKFVNEYEKYEDKKITDAYDKICGLKNNKADTVDSIKK